MVRLILVTPYFSIGNPVRSICFGTEPATTIQSPTTTLGNVGTTDSATDDDDGNGALIGVGIGVAAVAAAGGALLYFRNRGAGGEESSGGAGDAPPSDEAT